MLIKNIKNKIVKKGIKTFQHNSINLSNRNRGRTARIQIIKRTISKKKVKSMEKKKEISKSGEKKNIGIFT